MGGDRVHAHCGVAQQGAARPGEALCVHGDQRVGVALLDQLHVAQPVLELRLHLGRECGGLQRHQACGVGGLRRDHDRALRVARIVVRQGQHREGAFVAKAFVGGVCVGLGVAHAADDDGAAKVGHLGANAQLAACGRKAAVGRHHQRCAQALAGLAGGGSVGVIDFCVRGQGGHPVHLRTRHDAHARRAGGHAIGRAPQGVVGHDEAQWHRWRGRSASAVRHLQLHGAVCAHRAVVHMGGADVPHLAGGQARPRTQALQGGHAGVGERDLAAVGRGLLQRGGGVLVQHGGGKARFCQRDGQRQARWPGAHDEYVAVHVHERVCHWRKKGAGIVGRGMRPCLAMHQRGPEKRCGAGAHGSPAKRDICNVT